MAQTYPLPGAGGSLVSSRPVTPGELAQVAALYGPGGEVIADLTKSAGFGYGPWEPFTPALPGNVPPRSWQYPTGFNIQTSIRQEDGHSLSFAALRMLVSLCPEFRVAVEIRKKKMRSRTLEFVPRDRGQSASARKTPAYLAAVRIAKAFWSFPNRIDQLRFSGFLNQALEEIFITDGLVLFPWRTNGAELYALRQITPDTVKLNIDELGTVNGYQQILYGRVASDYAVTPTDLDRDELLYLTYNPRVDTAYGTSPIEEIVTIVQLAIRRLIYQLEGYREGNIPPACMEAPEGMTVKQIAEIQAYFDSLAGELERHRLLVVPRGSAIKPITAPILFTKDEAEHLATLVFAHLGVPRSTIVAQVNRATAEVAAQEAEDSGQKPLEVWFKEWMDDVTQNPDYLGLEELEVQWSGENVGSAVDVANARVMYVTAGIMTIDETRAEMGKDPLEAQDVAPVADSTALVSEGDGSAGAGAAAEADLGGGAGADGGAGGAPAGGSTGGAVGSRNGDDARKSPGGPGPNRARGASVSRDAATADGETEEAEKAAREELATWRRFALKPERVKRGRWADPFEATAIPPTQSADLVAALSRATTSAEARAVFDAVTIERKKRREHPATPIEKSFLPHAGHRGAEIGRQLVQILAGAQTAEQVRHAIHSHRDELVDAGLVNVLAGAILKARAKGLEKEQS